jgi:mitochondrial fission protein ELM1
MALAEALGWPCEVKRIAYRDYVPHFMLGASLKGVVRSRSSELSPPWPDLVISAGVRNEAVARWIGKHADRPVRLVYLGRTWARLEHFDLVITTPQYRLPEHPRVLQNSTTMHRVTKQRLTEAAATWSPRLANLPKPYIAVVVGGSSGPYTLGRRVAVRLGRQASEMAKTCGGSLLVTTSARTSHAATEALSSAISAPVEFYQWTPSADDNPYLGFLAVADAIIVTGDSIAMLTDACATRKPVYIFDLGDGKHSMSAMDVENTSRPSRSMPWWKAWDGDYIRAFGYRLRMKLAPLRLTREIRIVHEKLISSGHAVWLGDEFPTEMPPPLKDVSRAVARIRALFESQAPRDSSGDARENRHATTRYGGAFQRKVYG